MKRSPARLAFALALFIPLPGCFNHPGATKGGTPAAPSASPTPHSGRYAEDKDSTPTTPPDVSKIPEPVPKAEPPSPYGNKSPYTVLGESYRVLPNCKGYGERGIASWYGNKFHGYTTSDLERYDMYAYSAAHKTLPLPCYVRVTNLENGRSVVVRVNDRGPFVSNRIIDLSYVAAVKIGVWPKGTALVEVRGIDPEHPERAAEPSREHAVSPAPQKTPNPTLYLQVGAYAEAANAEHAAAKVRAAHLGDVHVIAATVDGKLVHRVRLGPLRDVDETDRLTPRLKALGLGEPVVAVE
jgi:rare lipoprotein A